MLKKVGVFLFLLGLGLIILDVIGVLVNALAWIDQWGAIPGLIIRVGAVVLGAVLVCLDGELKNRRQNL